MKTQPNQPAGNFLNMLQTKTGGVSLAELDHELAALVKAVRATGKAGALTYKIKIIPNARAGVKLEDDLSVKTPKEATGSAYFFTTDDGALLRNDPNQTELPLRVLPEESQDKPKVINA